MSHTTTAVSRRRKGQAAILLGVAVLFCLLLVLTACEGGPTPTPTQPPYPPPATPTPTTGPYPPPLPTETPEQSYPGPTPTAS
ncbi:MAG: hypothetical protein ACE5MB_00110 [Anaerolineae bacterium]